MANKKTPSKKLGRAKVPRMLARSGNEARINAIRMSQPQTSGENVERLLQTLVAESEPADVRLAALQALQSAAIADGNAKTWRVRYIAALRKLTGDEDLELRQSALGLLAREKDGFTQKKLIDGLKNPAKALVPAEKALQLLSYDPHTDVYAVARAIVASSPNADAKREALRLLGADAASVPLFEKILRDKGEASEVRQISAAALQALKPQRLQEHAREILMDTAERQDIQATCLVALTNFGDNEAISADTALVKRVNRLRGGKASAKVRRSATAFVTKYGGE